MLLFVLLFFFTVMTTTEIYTLSLHDALPICAELYGAAGRGGGRRHRSVQPQRRDVGDHHALRAIGGRRCGTQRLELGARDRKSTRLNSSHGYTSYAVFCLKKKMTSDAALVCI